jgi:Zn-finger nucleic acid-binding protein
VNGQCVICAREAERGYLDEVCFGRLASMIRQIEDEAAILETIPSMAIRSGAGGGSLASHRSPAVLDAIVARDPRRGTGRIGWDDADPWGLDDTASVLETLDSRCRTVHEEGGFDLPAPNVAACRDFLTRNLDWIARQPWIDEMFKEFLKLLIQLQRTNKTQADRPVGICHLPRFESTCGGRIWQREQERMIWRQADEGSDRCVRVKVKVSDGPAYCERCRAVWDDPKELARLELIEEQRKAEALRPRTADGRDMLTAQELVDRGYVSSVSNVRVKAHRLGVSAVHGHYDPDPFRVKDVA